MDIKKIGEFDSMMARITITSEPIKTIGDVTVSPGEVEKQALRARDCLVAVDYANTHGTCGDERERVGLASGEATVKPRPSTFGGPNIYALYVAELSGFFNEEASSGEERLRQITTVLNATGIKSGGHKRCAANAGFGNIVSSIADPANQPAIEAYAQKELGDDYNQGAMNEVIAWASEVKNSRRYDNWDESVLERVLGDEAEAMPSKY